MCSDVNGGRYDARCDVEIENPAACTCEVNHIPTNRTGQ
jgi:hypothetical protein